LSNSYKFGWFSTGRDKAARDLLAAAQNSLQKGEIKAEIAFVFSNREPGESAESDRLFKMVEGYHLPLICFSYQKFRKARGMPNPGTDEPLPPWRLDYDEEVMQRLQSCHPDLCVLAGYMLIAGPEMCRRYDIINLHPAAPGGPAGTWQEVIWALMKSQARESGLMMHLVTPELDRGPVVTYGTYPIRGEAFDRHWAEIKGQPIEEIKTGQGENNRLFQLIRQHGLAREFPLIIATLKAFSQGRIRINPQKQVVDTAGKPMKGYDLTSEINRAIREMI
jgi:folate-dependent phosphoribosylglycinamide formyltransferase PurN